MRMESFLRYMGNSLLIIGHFTLLWGNIETALMIKIAGGLAILPFAYRWKLWDVMVLELTFGSMDVTKLTQLLLS